MAFSSVARRAKYFSFILIYKVSKTEFWNFDGWSLSDFHASWHLFNGTILKLITVMLHWLTKSIAAAAGT